MPIVVQAAFILLAVAGLLVAVFVIPTLRQIRRTAGAVEHLTRLLERELEPTLTELKEALQHLNAITGEVKGGMGVVGETLEALQETGKSLKALNALLFPRLIATVSFLKGVRTGLGFIAKRLRKGEGGGETC